MQIQKDDVSFTANIFVKIRKWRCNLFIYLIDYFFIQMVRRVLQDYENIFNTVISVIKQTSAVIYFPEMRSSVI